jgi:hypothetical protein
VSQQKNKKSRRSKVRMSLRSTTSVDDPRPTGQRIIAAMRALPHRDVDIEPERFAMPVRDVTL